MSGHLRQRFELRNSVSIAEQSSWRHRSNLGCISIISTDDKVIELSEEDVIDAWEAVPASKSEHQLLNIW